MEETATAFKEIELGPIPVEWEVVQISEVAEVKGGGTPSTKKPRFWNGAIPFLTPSDVTSNGALHISRSSRYITEEGLKQSSAKLMPPGSVLMTSRATIGEVAICDVPMATNQGFINIIARSDKLANEFLAYWITWRKEFLRELGTGTTFKEVSKGVFKTVRISLPPLPEQRRIAHVLSTIQQAIAAQDDLIAAAREVKRSLMQRLFTYGPAPEPTPTKETEIGEIPEHWEVVRLDGVLRTTQYGLSVRADRTGTYPMLRMNNLADGRVDASDLKFVDLDRETFAKFRVHKGDVLFNRTNSYELVGKTAIFDLEGEFVFASYLIRIVPDVARLLPQYLSYYLNWDDSQRRLKMLATRGVSQSNISATKLKQFAIGLPLLAEQQEIAYVLLMADRRIAAEEQRKAALQALFKTMLHQLMTGRIRV